MFSKTFSHTLQSSRCSHQIGRQLGGIERTGPRLGSMWAVIPVAQIQAM